MCGDCRKTERTDTRSRDCARIQVAPMPIGVEGQHRVGPMEAHMIDEERQDLPALAASFPPAARGLRARIIQEYRMIESARRHGWSWPDIAVAMAMPGRASSISTSFCRVKALVKAGELEVPDGPKGFKATQPSKPVTGSMTTAKSGSGGIPPPPLPGGKATVKSIDDGMAEIRKKFDN